MNILLNPILAEQEMETNRACVERTLELLDVEYTIAGGYARDKFYGVTPKDCDIWVYQLGRARLVSLICALHDLPMEMSCFEMYDADPDNPNTACIEMVLKVPGVDVIIMNDCVETMSELVDRFDCNLNRFIVGTIGTPYFMGSTGWLTTTGPTEYKQQHQTSEKRMAKMRAKWEELHA